MNRIAARPLGGLLCARTKSWLGALLFLASFAATAEQPVQLYLPDFGAAGLYSDLQMAAIASVDARNLYYAGQYPPCTYVQTVPSGNNWLAEGDCGSGHTTDAIATVQPVSWCEAANIAATNGTCPVIRNNASVPKNLAGNCCVGNPINAAIGNKYQRETDYVGRGSFPLGFVRHYNSFNRTALGIINIGSRWSFLASLVGTSPSTAKWYREDGRILGFTLTSGTWEPDADAIETLTRLTNSNGATTGWRLKTENDETDVFDANGKLTQKTSRSGLTLTFTYSDASGAAPNGGYLLNANGSPSATRLPGGLLVRITDSGSRTLNFAYDTNKRLFRITDPAGGVIVYQYNAAGMLGSVTYPDNNVRSYLYNEPAYTAGASLPNALTGITDELGVRFATFQYDVNGLAVNTQHAGGAESVSITYNADGTSKTTDVLGANRDYSYSTTLGVAKTGSQSQPCAGSCTLTSATYDANGNLSSKTDFDGNVTQYSYDLTRNLETSRTEAFGTPLARTITTQWHATYRLPIEIDEPGRRTTFSYDGNGNLLSKTITDTVTNESRTTSWTYDAVGRVLSMNGPRTDVSDVTSYTYDAEGNLSTVANALNQTTQITNYDAHGNPLRIVDPNGVTTTLTYDARQRLKTRTVAGALTSFDYDAAGQLTKTTLPDGSFIQNTYDAAHRLTDVTDNLGNTIHYTLDGLGNRTRTDVKDPSGNLKRTQSQVFDVLGRLSELHGANGQVTIYGYDNQGNRTTETQQTSAGNFTTTTAYDALNRVSMVTDAATPAGVTRYGYNALSQLVSVQDPTMLTTQYGYNALGDLKQLTSPDTGVTGYTYDSAGNRRSQTDARGITVGYSYDALNRLTSTTYPTSAENVAYFYDGIGAIGAGAANGVGRLTGIADASGTTAYSYWPRGPLAGETHTISGVSYTTSYSYDSADRLTSEAYPSGRSVTYSRDALGRVSSVTTTSGANTTTLANGFTYLPFGPATGWTLGNGVVVTHSYDQDYRLTNYTDSGVLNRTLSHDERDLITGITDNLLSQSSQTLSYDALERLATASGSYGSLGYAYNAAGDRTQETRNGVPDNYSYASGSHRLAAVAGPHAAAFSYDASGNATRKNAETFDYNNAGRLTTVSNGTASAQDVYNASGQRVIKTAGSQTTVYHRDATGALIAETDATGILSAEYMNFEGQPLAYFAKPSGTLLGGLLGQPPPSGLQLYYFHVDQLGTPQKVTDGSQSVVWDASYEPFGNVSLNTTTIQNPLRFPGQYYDAETGLYQNWNRDYDPSIGSYLQSDPIGLWGGLNTYGYAYQDPVAYIDPEGLQVAPPASGSAAVAAGGAATVGAAGAWKPGDQVRATENTRILPDIALYPRLEPIVTKIVDACMAMTPEEKKKKGCQALRDSIRSTCAGLTGMKKIQCFAAAEESYHQCMQQD